MKKDKEGLSTENTQTPNDSKNHSSYSKSKSKKNKLQHHLSEEKTKPSYSNSLPTQRMRLLTKFLQGKKLTTFQARDEGIMHPAGRVRELKHQGYDIVTYRVRERDLNGVMHYIGQYIYKGRKNKKKEGK
ncbi:helix-turn-helix domain-containing protein [Rickettsiella massiliensis]|uniref:helix-turn-helix domain-containing protein n=1 Tax=Rickettsiella massiliensis TaxID=676517 RepID=UPI00029A1662|nr:helix-turn-helix domain-containing protein [Rickettsiella massiliensis]